MTAKNLFRWAIGTVVVTFAAFGGVSTYFAWKFTGSLRRPLGHRSDFLPPQTESVQFRAQDGVQLSGWFIPNASAQTAVILLHGHGGTRQQMAARARLFFQQGHAVLLYDARGHGESAGERTSVGFFEKNDLLGAFAFLREKGFHSFGCVGASQGGATIALAADELTDLRWAVLESTYPTLRDAMDRRFRHYFRMPLSLAGMLLVPIAEWRLHVTLEAISPAAHVGKLTCPVLIMAGDRDLETPPASTRMLFDSAAQPKTLRFFTGAGHVDLYGFDPPTYERAISEFVASIPRQIGRR